MRARNLRWILTLSAAVPLASCTWLVDFKTLPEGPCDGGACMDARVPDVFVPDVFVGEIGLCTGTADGSVCGSDDPCHDAPTCVQGACVPHPKPDKTPCAAALDACHSVPTCTAGVCGPSTAFPDGTQWKPGDDNARCCSAKPIETTSVTNCGVCGVACNTGKGQSCGPVNGHYFCVPCTLSGDCWSGCCSNTTASHCSPSNCVTGICQVPNVCPDMAHCQMDVVNYCSY